MAKEKYKFIEHTADVQFESYGETIEDAFSNAAVATSRSITDDKIEPVIEKTVDVSGRDNENLLYNFLEEILILFDSEHFILSGVKDIKIENGKLSATLIGDLAEKYETHVHIKAVTYSEMKVEKLEKWVCRVTLDI